MLTSLHSIFEHALDRGLVAEDAVRCATVPGRRRSGDANPDLHFLTVEELEAVIRAIPDEVVAPASAPTRRSVPMGDRLEGELDRWSPRTVYSSDVDFVLPTPRQAGR